jgi:hypothetical protein
MSVTTSHPCHQTLIRQVSLRSDMLDEKMTEKQRVVEIESVVVIRPRFVLWEQETEE